MSSDQIVKFITEMAWPELPDRVRQQARRCLLDTLGAAIGGRQTSLSAIIHDFAATNYGGDTGQLWLDGRFVSSPGAALANGMTIDALDIHDGYTLTKGHAGAAVVPAALVTVQLNPAGLGSHQGQQLLTSLAVGYEVALRAGRALHATACDYHTSGAWNALGCAAITSRCLGSDPSQVRHALGIAEYHGPRSQMMRCVDHPTMLKDGSGWGAMVGVSAGLMAHSGFTGAPAVTVEAEDVAEFWEGLGEHWLFTEQYFKPYAVCRWAQPAIAGALSLRQRQALDPGAIRRIRIFTFHEAVRLAGRRPLNTEEAQYSLPFPVAAALVHGQVGPAELKGAALTEAAVLALSDLVELVEDVAFSERFPRERFARVEIETADGRLYDSGPVEATWGADDPPSDEVLRDKFRWLAQSCLSPNRTAELAEMVWHCHELTDLSRLIQLLTAVPDVLAGAG